MHLPCRTVLHCCSSLGKGKGDSEEEHTESAVARLPWILPSARPAIATDQPAQQGMLVEESRLCPLRPRSQFVFLAACGTRPCCSRWWAASTRTLELLRYLAASKRPAAPHMVMGHAGAVAAVQRSKAYIVGPSAGGSLQQRTTQYVCCRSYAFAPPHPLGRRTTKVTVQSWPKSRADPQANTSLSTGRKNARRP